MISKLIVIKWPTMRAFGGNCDENLLTEKLLSRVDINNDTHRHDLFIAFGNCRVTAIGHRAHPIVFCFHSHASC